MTFQQLKTIEKVFDCPVINEYGARDAGIIAYQCPNGKMHISAENMIVEILDIETRKKLNTENPALWLVGPNLNNFSMPRIRYLLGDIAALVGRRLRLRKVPSCHWENWRAREDDIFVSFKRQLWPWRLIFLILHAVIQVSGSFRLYKRQRTCMLLRIIKSDVIKESENKILYKWNTWRVNGSCVTLRLWIYGYYWTFCIRQNQIFTKTGIPSLVL